VKDSANNEDVVTVVFGRRLREWQTGRHAGSSAQESCTRSLSLEVTDATQRHLQPADDHTRRRTASQCTALH